MLLTRMHVCLYCLLQCHLVSELHVGSRLLLSTLASEAECELQALPPGDLRHLLSRGKSNTDEVTREDPVEPRAPLWRQASQQQQAPRIVHDLGPPRSRPSGPARHVRR